MSKLKDTYGIVKLGERMYHDKNKSKAKKLEAIYNAADMSIRISDDNIAKMEISYCKSLFKILIVDDDVDAANTHFEYIRKVCKFPNIKTAYDGAEALKILQEDKDFDLVLADYRMPILDGEKLYRKVCKLENPPNYMIISGAASECEINNLKEAGIVVLSKPLTFERLQTIVNTYYVKTLDKWRGIGE